eukprot:CAMPEP_0113231402 /NCGR_PEP_ID=MMETSP0008_2-20120614/1401_1 /TAXON_ID=97485 /ORGANISM="Prymnesium parvum" /LENGTH=404 /DNA_ID=CAMNT_0000078055 /DNA_START=89 /DNA_END=1303 /DNA_ORIENTATION=- /assembly_acc=CAM_ASM_000153
MNMGAVVAAGGDRKRLVRELDRLSSLGMKNVRVLAASEGPDQVEGWFPWRPATPWRIVPSMQPEPGQYNLDVVAGLDFLLAQLGKRNMTAVLILGNMWPWSGGFAQYVSWATKTEIPYMPPADGGDWDRFQRYSVAFYSNENALRAFAAHVKFVLTKRNEFSGVLYRDDPTIMAYQLANEPRAMRSVAAYRKWISDVTSMIKHLSPNHLVTIGSEGRTPFAFSYVGIDPVADHSLEGVDYMTIHVWPQNWDWYDPLREETMGSAINRSLVYIREHVAMAAKLGKPLVIEEFGTARDDNLHEAGTPLRMRDQYYSVIFGEVVAHALKRSPLVGANFWAWAGEGRPRMPRTPGSRLEAIHCWQPNDPLIGDPPHEGAGWYSVYNTDTSTTAVLKNFSALIDAVDEQ